MKTATLQRFAYTPHGTLGRLLLPSGVVLYTVEPPWEDNKPNISCIPEATYGVKRDTTGRFKYYQLQDVPGRSAIEIHPANYFINPNNNRQELHGCIAPGMELNTNHIASVLRSREACDEIWAEFGDGDWVLDIVQYRPHQSEAG